MQPTNPIAAAWKAATRDQREEFALDHGEAVYGLTALQFSDEEPRREIWLTCLIIHSGLDEASEELRDRYDELRQALDRLRDEMDDEAADDDGLDLPACLDRRVQS